MSQGHRHCGGPGATQNQGNVLGDRPCVRQSQLYRQHVGGNAMKEMLGQGQLKWDTTRQEGCYSGMRAWAPEQQMRPYQQQQPMHQQPMQQPMQHGSARAPLQPQQQQQQQMPMQPFAMPAQQMQMQQPPQMQYQQQPAAPAQQQQYQRVPEVTPHGTNGGHRKGAGMANRQTFNVLTGQ